MMNEIKKILNDSKNEYFQLEKEFSEMSIRNKNKKSLISSSMSNKLRKFEQRKQMQSKHFDIIRNK